MTKKFTFFHKKVILKFWSAKVFFRPPKLGAKSPSMATHNNHIIYVSNQLPVLRHASFIHRRPLPLNGAWVFLASACPAPHGLPQGSGL